VQSRVSRSALHHTNARIPQFNGRASDLSGPENSTNRINAMAVNTASGSANSDARALPSAMEMRAIATLPITYMAKMKRNRASNSPR
jgi:hypothetical protein